LFPFEKPENSKKKDPEPKTPSGSEDESEHDEEEMKAKLEKVKDNNGRSSVSAEVYGSFNKKTQFVPKIIPKSEPQNERIRQKLQTVWMFNNVGNSEKEILIKVMEEKKFKFIFFFFHSKINKKSGKMIR